MISTKEIKRSTGKNFLLLITAILGSLIFLINTALADPDTPTITSPLAQPYTGGDYITFSGSCFTTDAIPVAITGSSLSWTSSQDGILGTGGTFSLNTLQSGTHTITLTATDNSISTTASVSISVTNNEPTSTINTPSDEASFNAGTSVSFTGTGTDIDTGDTLSYSWASSIDTAIGTGSTIATSSLTVGTHVIVLTVTDDALGSTASAPITIHITNNAPTATILSPSDNDTFYKDVTINFNGTGSDIEDASGVLNYAWSCSVHGTTILDAAASFTKNTLVEGDHTITFTVTDTNGASNTTPQSITIHVGNYDPVATITAPGSGPLMIWMTSSSSRVPELILRMVTCQVLHLPGLQVLTVT